MHPQDHLTHQRHTSHPHKAAMLPSRVVKVEPKFMSYIIGISITPFVLSDHQLLQQWQGYICCSRRCRWSCKEDVLPHCS